MHAFGCTNFEQTDKHRFAEHRFHSRDLIIKKTIQNSIIINVSCMAENRTYYVIVAQFRSEIRYYFSVTLTLKSLHMINLVSFLSRHHLETK